MQQHMIPQDVTGYKFNLFGILNLRQFLELIIPIILAYFIYWVGLPLIVGAPIIGVLVLYGVLAAFVPINDKSISFWASTFFQQLYAPTKFYWRRSANIPAFLLSTEDHPPIDQATAAAQDSLLAVAQQPRINSGDYFQTIGEEAIDPLEAGQDEYVNELLSGYDQIQVGQVTTKQQILKPNVANDQALRARPMK